MIRNPLSTKKTCTAAHAPGSDVKLEWYTSTAITTGARTPVSGGRSPSRNLGGVADPGLVGAAPDAAPSVGVPSPGTRSGAGPGGPGAAATTVSLTCGASVPRGCSAEPADGFTMGNLTFPFDRERNQPS